MFKNLVICVSILFLGYTSPLFATSYPTQEDTTINMNDTDTTFTFVAHTHIIPDVNNNNFDRTDIQDGQGTKTTLTFTDTYAPGWYYLTLGVQGNHYLYGGGTIIAYKKSSLIDNILTVRGHAVDDGTILTNYYINIHPTFTCEGAQYPTLSTASSITKQVALGIGIRTWTNVNITALPVDIIEGTSGALTYISKISVYLDADQDGVIDDSETLLGSTTSPTADNLISLSGLNINNTTKYVLIALDFNTTGISNTYNYRVKVPQSEITGTSVATALSSTSRSTNDVNSNLHSITYGSFDASLSYNGIATGSWSSLANQTVKVLDFLVTTSDNLSFNSFIVNITENNLLDNFVSMTLYKDTNDDGLTTGETAIQQITTFASDNITFSPGVTINNTTNRYLVELVTSGSSAGTSSENQTFSFKANPVFFNLTQDSITAAISGSSMLNGLSCTFTAPAVAVATTTTPVTETKGFGLTDALVGAAAAGAAGAVETGLQ